MTGVTYNSQGILSQLNLGNGTHETFAYNDRFQMTSQSLMKGAEVLQKYDYSYGQTDVATGTVDATKNNGQLGKIESFIGANKQASQRFAYDQLGRLKEAREHRGDNDSLTYKQVFDFDRFGNLYRKESSNPVSGQANPLPYTPIEDGHISKTTNRFTSDTTYDDAGQVIADNKFRELGFAYDANGRQVKATKTSQPDAWTVYDALGNRVGTKINDVWQLMVYDAFGKLVAEYGVAAESLGGIKYVQQDWQGSVRTVSNSNGFVIARTDHQAFGEDIGIGVGLRKVEQGYSADKATRQGYGLTENDESSGLNHTWFRKLEQRAGRWSSPDPYKGSIYLLNPQSFNRYSYVLNDPITFVDPSGLCTFRINITGNIDSKARTAAENELRRIFEQAGHSVIFGGTGSADRAFDIDVGSWKDARVKSGNVNSLGATEVGTHVVGNTTYNSVPLPFGSAYLDRIRTSLAGDRKLGTLGTHPTNYGTALGRVIAHEAGHHFLRLLGHSTNGTLMQERFKGDSDLFRRGGSYNSAFHFTPDQAKQLATLCEPQVPSTRSHEVMHGGGGGGFIGGYVGGGGYPSWWFHMQDFLRWVNSIPVGNDGWDVHVDGEVIGPI